MGKLILSHMSNPSYTNRRIHFYISSGGNAGLAAVCAARSYGHLCTVVTPFSTSPLMAQKLRNAGAAEVVKFGDTIAVAEEYMRDVVMKDKKEDSHEDVIPRVALHPFDHEAIWEGNSTIIDELVHQLPPAYDERDGREEAVPMDAIICSVGGGGLLNGLVLGLERNSPVASRDSGATDKVENIHILAVETDGTASLALAISKKSLVSLPKITSLATSLGCVRVSEQTLNYALSPPPFVAIHSMVLSDTDAAKGVLRLVDDERVLVELACGVCIEAAVGYDQELRGKKRKRNAREEGYGNGQDNDGRRSDSEASISDSANELDMGITMPRLTRLRKLIPDLQPESRVVIIVCGGSNVTVEMASEWREKIKHGWSIA
jgi:L-serine/L-threonine ammonia-lyase